jgi:hypothetical protein
MGRPRVWLSAPLGEHEVCWDDASSDFERRRVRGAPTTSGAQTRKGPALVFDERMPPEVRATFRRGHARTIARGVDSGTVTLHSTNVYWGEKGPKQHYVCHAYGFHGYVTHPGPR